MDWGCIAAVTKPIIHSPFYYYNYCSCGEVYHLSDEVPPIGNLGRVTASETDTSGFHVVSETIKVSEVIGRSIVISSFGGER